ncbi:MAG: hypothetical protein ABSG67_21440 [Thermoguttaceae bacterium]|jgi:hypothetical protein
MPDKEGKLSADEQQKIIKWIMDHSAGLGINCPICKQKNWGITEHLIYLPIYTPNALTIGGPTYPCVQLICNNCGSVQLINAVHTGVLANSPPDKKEVTNG